MGRAGTSLSLSFSAVNGGAGLPWALCTETSQDATVPVPSPGIRGEPGPGERASPIIFTTRARDSGSTRDTHYSPPTPPPAGQDDAESKNGFGKHDAKQICSFRHSMCSAHTSRLHAKQRQQELARQPALPQVLKFDHLDWGSDLWNVQFFANGKTEIGK